MIRLVLDTNIVISALLQPLGLPAKVFVMAIAGSAVRLCVTGEVYAEYEEVIRRPRLNRSIWEIEETLRAIREQGFWIRPSEKVRACFDPDDDIFLECALAAQAQFLVTGNVKHFPPRWAETRIVTARQFLNFTGALAPQG
ncbi:MAG TPA: putative toxin-antitoxin system toxin component, PIN family [Candidatus Solibacter sp.]|jgi:putative PIN family toxin of toxin-antitoxin system|nr:putative toxin-antitoxin system toxin component, PIN family [Candidatus Solibacter sp.]